MQEETKNERSTIDVKDTDKKKDKKGRKEKDKEKEKKENERDKKEKKDYDRDRNGHRRTVIGMEEVEVVGKQTVRKMISNNIPGKKDKVERAQKMTRTRKIGTPTNKGMQLNCFLQIMPWYPVCHNLRRYP